MLTAVVMTIEKTAPIIADFFCAAFSNRVKEKIYNRKYKNQKNYS